MFNLMNSELSVVLTKTKIDKASLLQVKKVKKLYQCELCDKTLATNSGLLRHKRQCGDKEPQFACPYCSRKFFRNDNKDLHVRNVHSRKKKGQRLSRTSTSANKTQSATTALLRNTKGQFIPSPKKLSSIDMSMKYVCPTCGNRYNQKKRLENHLKSQCANNDKDVFCKFCPMKFYREYDLKRHLYRRHKVPKESISRILEDNGN